MGPSLYVEVPPTRLSGSHSLVPLLDLGVGPGEAASGTESGHSTLLVADPHVCDPERGLELCCATQELLVALEHYLRCAAHVKHALDFEDLIQKVKNIQDLINILTLINVEMIVFWIYWIK